MSPELTAAFDGLALAALTAATGCVTALGIAGVAHIWRLRKRADRADELDQKRLELAQLEVDEKIRAKTKALAVDAAAIAQETSLGRREPLSGIEKASLAADKLRELEPALATADRSMVTDLVKIGAAQLRQSGSTTFSLSQSMAPPPERISVPERFPAPGRMPAMSPATKTSPERPGAKR